LRKIKKELTPLKKRDLALSELDDPYWEKLEKLVEKKRKKHEGLVAAPAHAEDSEAPGAEVIDLLSVLRESLKKDKGTKAKSHRAHKTAHH
jgi:non-homologous end joining protein Ku